MEQLSSVALSYLIKLDFFRLSSSFYEFPHATSAFAAISLRSFVHLFLWLLPIFTLVRSSFLTLLYFSHFLSLSRIVFIHSNFSLLSHSLSMFPVFHLLADSYYKSTVLTVSQRSSFFFTYIHRKNI